jgi:hypothetical protein
MDLQLPTVISFVAHLSSYLLKEKQERVNKKQYLFICYCDWVFYSPFILVALIMHVMGTTFINEDYIHEEIKSRLNFRHVCYHSLQNL